VKKTICFATLQMEEWQITADINNKEGARYSRRFYTN